MSELKENNCWEFGIGIKQHESKWRTFRPLYKVCKPLLNKPTCFPLCMSRSRENYKVCFKYCIFLFKTSSLSKKKISLSNQLMIWRLNLEPPIESNRVYLSPSLKFSIHRSISTIYDIFSSVNVRTAWYIVKSFLWYIFIFNIKPTHFFLIDMLSKIVRLVWFSIIYQFHK